MFLEKKKEFSVSQLKRMYDGAAEAAEKEPTRGVGWPKAAGSNNSSLAVRLQKKRSCALVKYSNGKC